MTSLTRENTAARNRRDMHETRIDETGRPRTRLALAWAWLFAEARHLPDHEVDLLARRVMRVARWLNGRRRR